MILAAVTAAATQVDLSPLIDPIVQGAGLIVTGLVGWAAIRFARYMHVSTQSADFQRVLGAVDRGLAYGTQVAQQKADGAANSMAAADLQTEAQRQAVNYVVTKLPDTLKRLNMTPQHVSDLVLAKLPPA